MSAEFPGEFEQMLSEMVSEVRELREVVRELRDEVCAEPLPN